MAQKLIFGLLWIGLILYALFLAPPDRPETWTLIQNLSTGQWNGINPLIIALFNVMGVIPLIYACFLLIDERGLSLKAIPFVLGSFALGAFAILPYLAIRKANPKFTGQKNRLLAILDSRWTGIMLTGVTLGILISGIYWGDWPDFADQWSNNRFIQVMSLDFLMLSLLFPTLIFDDMAHRAVKNPKLWEFIAFIPLLGALIYLSLRPPLLVSAPEDRPHDSSLPLSS